jgi:hypothetical protein
MIWLSAGSISYQDYGNWGDMVEPSGGLLTSFDGESVTLDQFIGYVKQYYEHLDSLTDDQRLRIVARGVVQGAGAIGDWRFIIGFYGASLVGATPQILSSLASLDSATVVVGYGESAGSPLFHMAVGADGEWIGAEGAFGDMEMMNQASWVRGFSWFQFSVPVLSSEAVMGTAGTTVATCVSGVCQAIWNGWVH